MRRKILLIIFLTFTIGIYCHAQFYDDFNKPNIEGWFTMTGDGNAEMKFLQKDNYASLYVDASADKYNVYWALIKRDVTRHLDLNLLKDTSFQLRVEARVRVHNAPRRLNFMVNTQRTVNYHIDLMEYDLQDTNTWYTISMTTKRFDAVSGDQVFVQLAATDFGPGKYYIDIDYYRADIVNVKEAGPDKGPLVPYHPVMPAANTFKNHLNPAEDCIIHSDFPDVNFNNWSVRGENGTTPVMTINGNQWIILRWNLNEFSEKTPTEPGLLELTTHSVSKGGDYNAQFGEELGMEFGKIRVTEIIGGDPAWDQKSVTWHSILGNLDPEQVFNAQMMFDTEINELPGGKTYITVSKYVLKRLINGTTKGLMIKPLGAVDASFYSSDSESGPMLHFTVE